MWSCGIKLWLIELCYFQHWQFRLAKLYCISRPVKVTLFCDLTPYNLVCRYQCFGRTSCLNLQSSRLYTSVLQIQAGGSSKSLVLTYKKTEVFILTVVRNSDLFKANDLYKKAFEKCVLNWYIHFHALL